MVERRAYLPAVVLLAGCALVWNTRSQQAVPLAAPLEGVLSPLPGHRIVNIKVSDEERRVAGMSDYVARSYWRDSTLAFTTLVSYYDRQTQGKTIHSPRNCLPGAGWEIVSGGERSIVTTRGQQVVKRYLLKNGRYTAFAYYWYQGRGRVESNEYRVKWDLLRDAATLGHTEEALVRVVVPIGAPTAAEAPAAVEARATAVGDSIASRMIDEVWRVLPGGALNASQRVASASGASGS